MRNCNIPHSKALFVGLLNGEASDLEGLGITYADQHANAKFNADHIHDLVWTLDGSTVKKINSFRFASTQFSFIAPTPWIFGALEGAGTSSPDGYYRMFKRLYTLERMCFITRAISIFLFQKVIYLILMPLLI